MGVSAAILFGATAVSGGLQAMEARKARKQAERLAAEERDRLAAEQAKEPPTMPDEEELRRTRRRSIASTLRRRGRASTILTSPDSDVLGA